MLLKLKIVSMFASWINTILKNTSKTKNWKVVFCNSTEYNQLNILLNEEVLGIEEKMLPMQTSHTLSSEDEKGRPSNEDNPDSSTNTGESESE